MAQVAVMAGGPASLPCSLATEAEDSVRLVLWFRSTDEKPIYTLDARGEQTNSSRDSVVFLTTCNLTTKRLTTLKWSDAT